MPLEHIGRPGIARRELRQRPPRMPVGDMLGAPEEVRHPADVTLGERELQVREVGPELGPDELGEGEHAHHRRRRHHDAGRGVRRDHRRPRRRAECVHSTALFSETASNNGYQYLVWMLGIARFRILRERHRVAALGRESSDFLGGFTSNSGRMPHGMKRPGKPRTTRRYASRCTP